MYSEDITYASLAKAFNQPLVYDAETLRRMTESIKHRSWAQTQNEEQKRARERMALFPANAELLFVARDIWVVSNHLSVHSFRSLLTRHFIDKPVVRLEGKLCVFPGPPSLFQKMLDGLKAFLPLPPPSERPFRHQIFTPSVSSIRVALAHILLTTASRTMYSLPESSIAPYLTELQKRVKEEGVRVGSYPLFHKGVFVSLIGQNERRIRELGKEVEGQTQGKVVTEQEVRERKGAVNL